MTKNEARTNQLSPQDSLTSYILAYQKFPESTVVPMDFWREPLNIWNSLSPEESLEEDQHDFLAYLLKKDSNLFLNFLKMMLGEPLIEHNVRLQNIYKSPILEKALSIEGSKPIFMQQNEEGIRNWILLLIRMNTHEGNPGSNGNCIIFRQGRALGLLADTIKRQFYDKLEEDTWREDFNIYLNLRE